MKKFTYSIIGIIVFYIALTLICNNGKLYQRLSFWPASIEKSKEYKILIDTFRFKNFSEFEIWTAKLKFIDYYGFGGLIKHTHESKSFYLMVRYIGKNKNKEFVYKFNNYNSYSGSYDMPENGELLSKYYLNEDSFNLIIDEKLGSINQLKRIDSVFVNFIKQ